MELKQYKPRVRTILKKFKSARNSDWALFNHYVERFHKHHISRDSKNKKCIRLEELKKLPSAETIIRCRRLIQNDDRKYLPTLPEVRKRRRQRERNFRDAEIREAKKV